MKTYLRLLSYVRPYRFIVIPFFVFTIIAVFFNVFQFTLLIPLLNFLFDSVQSADTDKYMHAPEFSFSVAYVKDLFYYKVHDFKTTNPVYALYFIAGIVVLAVIMTNLFRYLAQRVLVKGRTLLVKRLR